MGILDVIEVLIFFWMYPPFMIRNYIYFHEVKLPVIQTFKLNSQLFTLLVLKMKIFRGNFFFFFFF